MKKIIFPFIALGVIISLGSCKLIDKFTKFDIDYTTNYTIPATIVPIVILNSNTPDITTNSSTTFSNNNTHADRVEQVNLKKLKLTITSPSGQKFDFLKSAAVFISADGLPEIQVASIDNVDDSVGNTLDLIPSGADLKEYIKKDKITMRVSTTTDKVIANDVTVRIDATFFVDAKILGV